jgi:hypothetical protein
LIYLVAVGCFVVWIKSNNMPLRVCVQALHDLVLVQLPEAAQGKPFAISMATPGAQPLTDMTVTLKDAGVAGALLAVKWAES